MSQLERLYRMEQMLLNAPSVTTQNFLKTLEVSLATLKRDLNYLRDRLHVPLTYDRFLGGYKIEKPHHGKRHELPGLWFTAEEVKALLMMHKLLDDLDMGGLLGPHIAPLLERIRHLLSTEIGDVDQVMSCIHLQLAALHRPVNSDAFQKLSTALLLKKRITLSYRSRYSDSVEERTVSPQRLTYYKDNWYLAAHCHSRNALRIFSLDGMSNLSMLEKDAKKMNSSELSASLSQGYGIFNGGKLKHAVLEFTPDSARWVKDQRWHATQKNVLLPDGRLRITLPYVNDTELVVDILSWAESVKVISPASLREQVKTRLHATLHQYAECNSAVSDTE